MKLLVFSDSHGRLDYMEQAVSREAPDTLIHLGDLARDGEYISGIFPEKAFLWVPGNCDHDPVSPATRCVELRGVRLFMTHGHLHNVKFSLQNLYYAALEAGASVALFGHSHRPLAELRGDLWLLNPGCGALGTYGVICLEQGKITDCRVVRPE